MARTRNYADVIRDKLAANPALAEAVEVESFNADLATKVYEARTSAGLTQKQLADLVGTRQSVISRIEDADYDGHSLALLKRIASALGLKLRVEFCGPDTPEVELRVAGGVISASSSFAWGEAAGAFPFVSRQGESASSPPMVIGQETTDTVL
jgi:transcriptional regulator with XRE-family HTH domain